MKMFYYKELPVKFRAAGLKKLGNINIREFLAVRDNGTPVDRFSVFAHANSRHHTAWTGDTIHKEIKTMRGNWAAHLNKEVKRCND